MRVILASTFTLCGLVAVALSRPRERLQPAAGADPPPVAHLSSASCAATACHGGGKVGAKGSEHSTWAPDLTGDGPHDPHSRAYRVLFNDDSARMVRVVGDQPAHRQPLCLKCHAVEGVQPAEAVSEGVGCGACHGPAEKWLGAHVRPEWKGLSNRAKLEEYEFIPTDNIVTRAAVCAKCHVGDADREVGHDLVAAGHPRLAFEYTRFHFSPNYRHHWTETTPQPDFEVRAWVAGQAVTLRAATELLRVRAERAATRAESPWPEFAGQSCYACHQGIRPDANRGDAATDRPGGVAGWELWSNAAAGVAARHGCEAFPGVGKHELREVAALRALADRRNPDPAAMAKQAARAVSELDAWVADLQAAADRPAARLAPGAPRRLARSLAANALTADGKRLADHDWDALAANYLGCAALYHASGGKAAEPGWTDPLRSLTGELRLPPGRGSPAGFGRVERDRVRTQFEKLLDATASSGGKP